MSPAGQSYANYRAAGSSPLVKLVKKEESIDDRFPTISPGNGSDSCRW